MFPMTITKVSAVSRSKGTKAYHLVFIQTSDSRALLIKRYGKKLSWGSVIVHKGSYAEVNAEYDKIYRAKFEGDYTEDYNRSTVKVDGEEELKKQLRQYWPTLGAANIKFLLPDADTTGVKDPEALEWDQTASGRYVPKEKPPKPIKEYVPTEEERIAAEVAKNPNWGLFG